MKEQINKVLNGGKFKGKETMIVLILVGAVLAVMLIPTEKEEEPLQNNSEISETPIYDRELYEEQLEQRLEDILSKMDGVGKVEVMITLQASAKEVVEKDYSTQQSRDGDEASMNVQNSISKEETTVYADNGSGNTPYVVQEIYPEVEGVLVVAEGGDDSYVNIAIVEAIEALFDVDVHKIKIVKMNNN